jgi:hypothetical protein
MKAWTRIMRAIADQRDALQYRISREDPADTALEHDVQNFGELSRALAEYVGVKA